MTRREEIEKVANEFYKGDEVSTFVAAARWADETLIERVDDNGLPFNEWLSHKGAFYIPDGYELKDENGNVINAQKIVLEKLVAPKFKKGDKIKDKNNRVWYVVEVGNRHFDISRIPNPKGEGTGYFVPMEDQDDYELCPNRELPKTFEDCVSVLMCEGGNRMSLEQMNTFRKLIDARNAYWKIAGEEMGLGKPWEPDWTTDDVKHSLVNVGNTIILSVECKVGRILAFPSKEMRDEFYENFKELIEQCKELL